MASWYGILWKHANRHPERLRAAERERLVNDLLAQQRAEAKAQRATERGERGTASASPLEPAEQTSSQTSFCEECGA